MEYFVTESPTAALNGQLKYCFMPNCTHKRVLRKIYFYSQVLVKILLPVYHSVSISRLKYHVLKILRDKQSFVKNKSVAC